MKLGKKLRRVDVQVSILVILSTIFCTCSVYLASYYLTYNDMIKSLEDRVYAIHDYLDDTLNKETFRKITDREDMNDRDYHEAKLLLESTKKATNVMYLYTAKKNQNGDFIYVIDGLNGDAPDFRYPGDLIEEEICNDMQKALNGETVLPEGIRTTDWGKIFITYFPIHDGDEVIGVLGIEFEAGHQYETYRALKLVIPIVMLGTIVLATATAVLVFRRISNPTYRDMANTDQLTGMKNRNAFETDIRNMSAVRKKQRLGIIEADLNHLKKVNDLLGHGAGDLYIQAAARAVREALGKKGVVYRMGGDEFAALLRDTDEQALREMAALINVRLKVNGALLSDKVKNIPLTLSVGCALYEPEKDSSIMEAYERADREMYEQKKKYYRRQGAVLPEKKS